MMIISVVVYMKAKEVEWERGCMCSSKGFIRNMITVGIEMSKRKNRTRTADRGISRVKVIGKRKARPGAGEGWGGGREKGSVREVLKRVHDSEQGSQSTQLEDLHPPTSSFNPLPILFKSIFPLTLPALFLPSTELTEAEATDP